MLVLNAPYPRNCALAVLIAIDQLGNAIAGGHPDATISARVGYFSDKAPSNPEKDRSNRLYWKSLEKVIDLTFYPIDGKNHCYKAYLKDIRQHYQRGNDLTRVFLSIIILVACPLIAIVLHLLLLFIPKWRNKNS